MTSEDNRSLGTQANIPPRVVESVGIYRSTNSGMGDARSIQHSAIQWRAIFAGVFVSILTYMILMSLGIAIGGGTLRSVIENQNSAQGLGIGAGVWLVLSILISLLVGSYSSGRVSGMIPTRIGRTQGIVVASLFFVLLISQVGSAIGSIGRGLGTTLGAVGGAAGNAAQNPQVQSIVDDALGDLNLRSSPDVVAKGVATRLVQGNADSAITYLSRQAGISEVAARQRIEGLRQQVTKAATDAGTAAAQGLKVAGWTLFGSLLLGLIAGMLGGGLGAQASLRAPLSAADNDALDRSRRAA